MKRAAIIITDCGRIRVTDVTQSWSDVRYVGTSPQLLADLRTLVKAGEWATTIADWDPHRRKENELSVARVSAALGTEKGEGT